MKMKLSVIFLEFIVVTRFVNSKSLILKDEKDTTKCGYQACTKADPDKFNVHIIPHSHDDVGWTKTVDGYYYNDVQYLISTVVTALKLNPDRRFIQVETAFLKQWWDNQNNKTREDVRTLINNGQLEIINGGWSMNDEANVNYQSTIDQFTFALKFLEDTLGKCARPKIGWQIDPFGHTREQASIFAQMGFDGFFFARADYRDRAKREADRTQDFLWRGSANLGNATDIFTSFLYKDYSAPKGFCFDHTCNDEPLITDTDSTEYNHEQRVKDFADFITQQAQTYPTDNIMILMGDDFKYKAALTTYINLDRLIDGFKLFEQKLNDKTINVFYSTPTCYVKAVNDYVKRTNVSLDTVSDDFLPFGYKTHEYFGGYFTSRPTCKRIERQGNNLLQVAKQLAAAANLNAAESLVFPLKDAMGVYQHHDAITGTQKQAVADSYNLYLANGISKATESTSEAITFLLNSSQQNKDQINNLDLKTCLLMNVSYCEQTKNAHNFTVVLYNPLSRVVSHHITLPVDFNSNWKITDQNGNDVVYQITKAIKDFGYITDIDYSLYNLVFNAENLAPFGLTFYRVEHVDTRRNYLNQQFETINRKNIGFENTNIDLNEDTGRLESVTMNGVTVQVTQEFLYYEGDGENSGAYVFRPMPDQDPTPLNTNNKIATTISEGPLFYEVLQEINNYITQIIRIYKSETNYIEFDWIVGPIDISDNVGKEIITRFTTNLSSDATFYTDSNGREMLKRVRNYRETYEYTNEEPVAGNYYPITSRLVLKDENNEFAVLTDRAQAGGSLIDGQLELMVHRVCLKKDVTGEELNEFQYGQGLVVRGQHYIVVAPKSSSDDNEEKRPSAAAIQRNIAQRKLLQPWIFITSNTDFTFSNLSLLKRPLPDNVQLLTLEQWTIDSVLLLRLEHILEKNEDENLSKDVTIDLNDLFATFTVSKLHETTLAGNVPIEDSVRLDWPQSSDNDAILYKNADDDDDDGELSELNVTLKPMQIRTFLAEVQYNL